MFTSQAVRAVFVGLALVALLLGTAPLAAQNLIANPSFEINGGNGSPPDGWSLITNSYGAWNGIYPAQDGDWVLHAGANFQAGGRYQDVGTVANAEYTLSFWATGFISGADPQLGIVQVGKRGANRHDLLLNNSAEYVNEEFEVPLFTGLDEDWINFTHTFVAKSAVTRVSFQNVDLGPGAGAINIDDVSLLGPAGPPVPPEPVECDQEPGNLVYNGSFECNDGTGTDPFGWTVITNSYGAWNGIVPAQDGDWVLHAGANFVAGGRYQDLTTVPNAKYQLTFAATGFISGLEEQLGIIQVGTPGANDTDLLLNNNAEYVNAELEVPLFVEADDWKEYTFAFTALTDTTRLSFQNVDLGPGAGAINIDKVKVALVSAPIVGDFNGDGNLTVADIDLLTTASASANNDVTYDLNSDQLVDARDVNVWVKDLKKTWIGDADVNMQFNSADFVQVFAAGKYETEQAAVWSEGDWDGSGKFNSADFVAAFADGGYELGAATGAVSAVPEPSTLLMTLMAVLGIVALGRNY